MDDDEKEVNSSDGNTALLMLMLLLLPTVEPASSRAAVEAAAVVDKQNRIFPACGSAVAQKKNIDRGERKKMVNLNCSKDDLSQFDSHSPLNTPATSSW